MSRKKLSLLWTVCLLLPGCSSSNDPVHPASATPGAPTLVKKHVGVPGTLLADCRRIVFVGDSITYSGQFVDDVEMVVRRLSPASEFEFLDLGLPSETVSGLSEPGHAGGSFPRPTLHERLQRLLELTHPDLVIACYGMNDGIYYPFSQSKFEAFQQGIILLHERVLSSGAKIIHVTPPVFDAVPIRQHTLPAGRDEYRQPFEGYDTVLEHYSEWLIGQRKIGWTVIDAHSHLKHFLDQQRLKNPGFLLASDGVHMNDYGHWLLAQSLLNGLNVPLKRDRVIVDLESGKATGPGVTKAQKQNGGVTFLWHTVPPIPLPAGKPDSLQPNAPATMPSFGDEHCIVGDRTKATRYELFEGDKRLGDVSPEELSAGIDTRSFPELATSAQGKEMLRLIHTRNHMLSDSWLTTVGHKRPGMAKGLPVAEAVAQAEDLNQKIKELNQPVELRFRVEPVSP